ncbi:hypothetical protein EDD11_005073 [Mortierella claussenii]|nr:hypothetical protein EDD11_005073 [Mortierella claussenii]
MFIRTSIITTAALALLASMVEVDAHSWADCVDWRFNDPNKPSFAENAGTCHGWGRQYPMNKKPFGTLDSDSPNRHYQQDHIANPVPCSDGHHGVEPGADETRQNPISKAYGGKFGAMATVQAGGKMCVRWPAKNHAVPSEPNNPVFINMPQTILTKDPDQAGFMKATIAKLKYKNCNQIPGDTDKTPCGGCFTIPPTLAAGTYVLQWRWELNPGENYASCWDLAVTAAPNNGTLGGSTSVFADLAED